MSFVAGAFLLGLAMLALPWWLHRRDAPEGPPRPVSSLLLMRGAEVPPRRHTRVRHRWLLAARMALLAVLVLAFAQPLLPWPEAPPGAETVLPRVVVLDTSLSMAASFAAARRRALEVIDERPAGARAAVLLAGSQLTVAAPLGDDPGGLRAAVSAALPGAGYLAFAGLLDRVQGLVSTLTDQPVEVHLISDFQRSALPERFNELVHGVVSPAILHPIGVANANWRVSTRLEAGQLAVTVNGWDAPARTLALRVRIGDGEAIRRALTVPADDSATLYLALPAQGSEDTGIGVTLEANDALPGDDSAYQVRQGRLHRSLPLFATESTRQRRYLSAAVAAGVPSFALGAADDDGPVAVVLDAGALDPAGVRRLARHIDRGGAVLMTGGPATVRWPLLDLDASPQRFDAARGVVVADPNHPALAGRLDWDSVLVSRSHAAAGAHAAVLLATDEGVPLLTEHRLGTARVLVLATALEPDWSNLVTRGGFVAMLESVLGYLAADALPQSSIVGEPVHIAAGNVQLFGADGRRVLALGETVGRPSIRIDRPGIYRVRTPNRSRLLAVNVDGRESELVPAEAELLERWQSALPARPAANAPPARRPEPERRPLARWLALGLLILTLVEALGTNLARRTLPA